MRSIEELDPAALYERFCTNPQEPVRLSAALRGYFQESTPQSHREEYGAYLKRRIRPAAAAVMEVEDVDKLEAFARLGWLEDGQLDNLIRLARENQRAACLVWLLRRKQERGRYHDRDFSL